MRVRFKTNLDEYKRERWPNLYYTPQVGDYIQSDSGKVLRVVSRTWLYDSRDELMEVELHR